MKFISGGTITSCDNVVRRIPAMTVFVVDGEVFARLPEACFGVIIARGVRQPEAGSPAAQVILRGLTEAIEFARCKFVGTNVKSHPDILPYREAFQKLGINPNKFPSSIEAMVGRIAKGGLLPSINPAVDTANTTGLRHTLPLGVHDLDCCTGSIEVRMSREGDIFTPFGTTVAEAVDPGEIVYADGQEIRTRRWIWRQGEYSKATAASTNLFFPIDGFRGVNHMRILQARADLAAVLRELTGATVRELWVDSDTRTVTTD
jgi:DNA/RNA-binding domain of Phe-tRNA-synthetase-like protein